MTGQAIVANSVLPARRDPLSLRTADGLTLVGEIAMPLDTDPVATIICAHPLPTHGGMMDSHVLRKMSWRLPALARIAVVRFNTRGTTSSAGTSEGHFDEGRGEGLDLRSAIDASLALGLPDPWLLGWSFGTDVVLRHGCVPPVRGAILLSPPLRFADGDDLARWDRSGLPVVCLVPEFDDYLQPDAARERFAAIRQADVRGFDGARHLWVGERYVKAVLDAIVEAVAPDNGPLPTHWNGPMDRWSDL